MQFTIAFIAAFAALTTASPFDALFEKRAVSGPPSSAAGISNVVKDIQLAGQDLVTLGNAVNANGDTTTKYTYDELVAIINANQAVGYDVNNGSASANATKTFSSSDSCSAASARDALLPTVSSTMAQFSSHYDAMNNTGIAGITLQNIQQQRENARELINAIAAKATGTCTSNAARQSATMMAYFDNTIRVYQQ